MILVVASVIEYYEALLLDLLDEGIDGLETTSGINVDAGIEG